MLNCVASGRSATFGNNHNDGKDQPNEALPVYRRSLFNECSIPLVRGSALDLHLRQALGLVV